MARPRQYSSDAEKQAAYRDRLQRTTVLVDKRALEQQHARLNRLQAAIRRAADKGDSLALSCCAASTDTMLDKLILLFDQQSPQEETPKATTKTGHKRPKTDRPE